MVRKKIALDTNVVIGILNGESNILTLLSGYSSIYLPVTVYGELLFGAKNSAKHCENEQKYLSFIKHCNILNVDEPIAEQYAITRKSLKSKGRPIPENDIWIAATCIVNHIPLATFDSDFKCVDDLILVELKH